MNANPNFGDGDAPEAITYHTIAAQVRAMNPRTLSGNVLDDVITMVEYLRNEALRLYDANQTRSNMLDERERELNKRAKDLAVAQRIAKVVISGKPRKYFWR